MPKILSEEIRAERKRLYNEGLNDYEIAKRIGVTPAAVAWWRYRCKLPTHKPINRSEATLCWNCQNTNRYKCSWFDPDNQKPVEGWAATPTVKRQHVHGKVYDYHSYHVIECPKFIPEE